jgi:hypothetical protein
MTANERSDKASELSDKLSDKLSGKSAELSDNKARRPFMLAGEHRIPKYRMLNP